MDICCGKPLKVNSFNFNSNDKQLQTQLFKAARKLIFTLPSVFSLYNLITTIPDKTLSANFAVNVLKNLTKTCRNKKATVT